MRERRLLSQYSDAVGPPGCVVGIDISPDQIAAAKPVFGGNPGFELAVEDVVKPPFKDGGFDATAPTH